MIDEKQALKRLRQHLKGVPNPDWHRPFEVERSLVRDDAAVFLGRFTEPLLVSPEGTRLDRFGAVVSGPFVEAWPILTYPGEAPRGASDEELAARAETEMGRHRCPRCGEYVKFRIAQRRLGPEAIEVTYVCPECGHREVDVLD